MVNSTISMAMFNSFLYAYQRVVNNIGSIVWMYNSITEFPMVDR